MAKGIKFIKHKNNDYTVIDNAVFRDKNLSLKALGLLVKMLSLPPEWNYSQKGLVSISKEGESAVKATIKELQEYGYLKIKKVFPSDKNKKIFYEWHIYENPESQEGGFQPLENQPLENQPLENRIQVSKYNKLLNNKINNNIFKNIGAENQHLENLLQRYNEEWQKVIIEFIEYRNEIGKAFTVTGLKYYIQKLINYSNNNIEVAKKINAQAISGGYQDIRPLPSNSNNYKADKKQDKELKSEQDYENYSEEDIEKIMSI